MKIEHIAMYVNDLENTKDFFIKYFDAKANSGYHNKSTLNSFASIDAKKIERSSIV